MEISVIILTYNSSKFIDDLLGSLIEKYGKKIKDKKLEIILADNASSDDTVKKARKFEEFVEVIENGGNYGFAKGNNLAVKRAKGDFLIFMNPDAEIVKGNISDLIREFDDPKVGIVGGESMGLEEKTGVRFSPSNRSEVDQVSGAFLVIRADLFEKLGGFDEHYFMYVEDADLCLRVKKLGYKVLFSPHVTIKHMGQGSSNRKFAIVNIYKGLLYFHKKNMGRASYNIVKTSLKTKAFMLVLLGKLRNNDYLVDTYSEALKVK
jgi:GT2 family glycosyltransferase